MHGGQQDLRLSAGAEELLRIAIENDKHQALASNLHLLRALEFSERLVAACTKNMQQDLHDLFPGCASPTTFLQLTFMILQAVQESIDDSWGKGLTESESLVTDFGPHVLQGLAEALADTLWPERKANDFDGPPLGECIQRIAKLDRDHLWSELLKNYMGNILQHYFSAARVREKVPTLDPATETNLRNRDAFLLSRIAMQKASRKSCKPETRPEDVMMGLQEAILFALEGET